MDHKRSNSDDIHYPYFRKTICKKCGYVEYYPRLFMVDGRAVKIIKELNVDIVGSSARISGKFGVIRSRLIVSVERSDLNDVVAAIAKSDFELMPYI